MEPCPTDITFNTLGSKKYRDMEYSFEAWQSPKRSPYTHKCKECQVQNLFDSLTPTKRKANSVDLSPTGTCSHFKERGVGKTSFVTKKCHSGGEKERKN